MARQSTTSAKREIGDKTIPWLPVGFDMAMSLARVNGFAAQSLLRFNLEVLGFYKHRLEQDLKTINTLICCDNADEAMDVSRKFMQGALSEYSEKAGELADMSTKLAAETAEHVQNESASLADSIAARKVA